ncbi:MAG: polysaccharide pyruvyl transferase family protein [Oscillospiraceae bacterium]|nr:polysaccharide pyruvyl transferase family protein [Oscillospiraceae bacterium]
MTDTYYKIFDADHIRGNHFDSNNPTLYKSVITNNLHYVVGNKGYGNVQPNFGVRATPSFNRILDLGIRIVPISFGARHEDWENDFFPDDFHKMLKRMTELGEIGTRGELSTEILKKNGIKSRVIGCPSLYYNLDRELKIFKTTDRLTSININLNTKQDRLFGYAINIWQKRKEININFTIQDFSRFLITNKPYSNFLCDTGRLFFNVDDWINGIEYCDFSIGNKFHGNVAAILAGVPALFIVHDTRMLELCNYYKFPYIHEKDFDTSKPIEYYYELADYTEFNEYFAETYDNFIDYCKKNEVEFKSL